MNNIIFDLAGFSLVRACTNMYEYIDRSTDAFIYLTDEKIKSGEMKETTGRTHMKKADLFRKFVRNVSNETRMINLINDALNKEDIFVTSAEVAAKNFTEFVMAQKINTLNLMLSEARLKEKDLENPDKELEAYTRGLENCLNHMGIGKLVKVNKIALNLDKVKDERLNVLVKEYSRLQGEALEIKLSNEKAGVIALAYSQQFDEIRNMKYGRKRQMTVRALRKEALTSEVLKSMCGEVTPHDFYEARKVNSLEFAAYKVAEKVHNLGENLDGVNALIVEELTKISGWVEKTVKQKTEETFSVLLEKESNLSTEAKLRAILDAAAEVTGDDFYKEVKNNMPVHSREKETRAHEEEIKEAIAAEKWKIMDVMPAISLNAKEVELPKELAQLAPSVLGVNKGYKVGPSYPLTKAWKEVHGTDSTVTQGQRIQKDLHEWVSDTDGESIPSGSIIGFGKGKVDYPINNMMDVDLGAYMTSAATKDQLDKMEWNISAHGIVEYKGFFFEMNGRIKEFAKANKEFREGFKLWVRVRESGSGLKNGSFVFAAVTDEFGRNIRGRNKAAKEFARFRDMVDKGTWSHHYEALARRNQSLGIKDLKNIGKRLGATSGTPGIGIGSLDLEKDYIIVINKKIEDIRDLKTELSEEELKALMIVFNGLAKNPVDGQAIALVDAIAERLTETLGMKVSSADLVSIGLQARAGGLQLKSFLNLEKEDYMQLIERAIINAAKEGALSYTVIGNKKGRLVLVSDECGFKLINEEIREGKPSKDIKEIPITILNHTKTGKLQQNLSAQTINKIAGLVDELGNKLEDQYFDMFMDGVKNKFEGMVDGLYEDKSFRSIRPFDMFGNTMSCVLGKHAKYTSAVQNNFVRQVASMFNRMWRNGAAPVAGITQAIKMEEGPAISGGKIPNLLNIEDGIIEAYSKDAMDNKDVLFKKDGNFLAVMVKYPSQGKDEYYIVKFVSLEDLTLRAAMAYAEKVKSGEMSKADAVRDAVALIEHYRNSGAGTVTLANDNVMANKMSGLDKDFDKASFITEKAFVDLMMLARQLRGGSNGYAVVISDDLNGNDAVQKKADERKKKDNEDKDDKIVPVPENYGLIEANAMNQRKVGSQVGIIISITDALLTVNVDKMYKANGKLTKFGMYIFQQVLACKELGKEEEGINLSGYESILDRKMFVNGINGKKNKTMLINIAVSKLNQMHKILASVTGFTKEGFKEFLKDFEVVARWLGENDLDGTGSVELSKFFRNSGAKKLSGYKVENFESNLKDFIDYVVRGLDTGAQKFEYSVKLDSNVAKYVMGQDIEEFDFIVDAGGEMKVRVKNAFENEIMNVEVPAVIKALQDQRKSGFWVTYPEMAYDNFINSLVDEVNSLDGNKTIDTIKVKNDLKVVYIKLSALINASFHYAINGKMTDGFKVKVQEALISTLMNRLVQMQDVYNEVYGKEGNRKKLNLVKHAMDLRNVMAVMNKAAMMNVRYSEKEVKDFYDPNKDFKALYSMYKNFDGIVESGDPDYAGIKVHSVFGALYGLIMPSKRTLDGKFGDKAIAEGGVIVSNGLILGDEDDFEGDFVEETVFASLNVNPANKEVVKEWTEMYPNVDLVGLCSKNPTVEDVYGEIDSLDIVMIDRVHDKDGKVVARDFLVSSLAGKFETYLKMSRIEKASLEKELAEIVKDGKQARFLQDQAEVERLLALHEEKSKKLDVLNKTVACYDRIVKGMAIDTDIAERAAKGDISIDEANLVGHEIKSARHINKSISGNIQVNGCARLNKDAFEVIDTTKKDHKSIGYAMNTSVNGVVQNVLGSILIVSK